MTEVSFHFNVPDRTAYSCRLLRKALRAGAQVVVSGPDATLAEVDRALWTFDPLEFVPHLLVRQGHAVPDRLRATPVWLTQQPVEAGHHDVLVNLGDDAPEGFESYARLIEIVSTEPNERAAARQRWKYYAARGYPIQRHEVQP
jgi:DNA polymerase-3 subunit chi